MSAIEDSIRREINIRARAREDAEKETPAHSATAMTATENELVDKVRQKILEKVARFDEQKQQIDEKRDGFSRIFSDFDEKLASTEEEGKPDDSLLKTAQADMVRARYNYQQFKGQNNLHREAKEPNLAFFIFWAIMLAILEGLLNGHFFKDASEDGFFGGALYAFAFSGTNVIFAFFAGLCITQMNHINPVKAFRGLFGFLLLIVCGIIIALSALYRSALDALKGKAEIQEIASAQGKAWPQVLQDEAWALTVENFLSLNISAVFASINSTLLVFIGAICAIVGALEGYFANDPYPGFGNMGKQKREAEEDFEEKQEIYNEAVLQYRKKIRKSLDDALREMQKQFDQLNSEMRGYIKAIKQDDSPLQQALDLSRRLLSDYRDRNWDYRDGERPPYFEDYPSKDDFPRIAQVSLEWDARLKNADDMEERARKLSEEKNERVRKVQQIIREKLSQ